jgi:hypothetical protein
MTAEVGRRSLQNYRNKSPISILCTKLVLAQNGDRSNNISGTKKNNKNKIHTEE